MVERRRKIQEERKNEGRLEARHPPPPSCLPGVQFNSFPTDRRALLPESLEKATVVATAFVY